MRTYTRARIEGATYFFTVNVAERRHDPLLVRHIADLRLAFKTVQLQHPFTMDAGVVLPDHLHCLWTLPAEDSDFSMRWRLIKSNFSRSIARTERISESRQRRAERGIWQRRYWEHLIHDEDDFMRHLDYIHYNPVKHGHAASPWEWRHSSFRKWVKQEVYAPDWAAPDDVAQLDWE